MTLNDLLLKLFSHSEWENIPVQEDGKKYAYSSEDPGFKEFLDEVEMYACGDLITAQGGCNWKNISDLKKSGFDVYAGDKDSFGWLTGCIESDGKVFVYG